MHITQWKVQPRTDGTENGMVNTRQENDDTDKEAEKGKA
jgi:hypothetical protein